jgi:hypothetical protein
MTETTDFEPTYPTIPHIDHPRFIDSVSKARSGLHYRSFQKKTGALPIHICVTIPAGAPSRAKIIDYVSKQGNCQ